MKYGKIDSYKKGVVFSSGFNMLSKLLLFGQNLVLAYFFGAGDKIDIFFYAFTSISLFTAFITLLNGHVLIPESMRIRNTLGILDSTKFLNVFLYGYIILGSSLSLIVLVAPIQVFSALSKFSPEILIEYKNLLVLTIPLFTLMIIVNLLVDILTSFKYFTAPQVAKMINSLSAVIFLLCFHRIFDLNSILIGYYFGYIVNLIMLISIMRKQLRWNFQIKFYPIEKRIYINSFFAQAGNLFTMIASYYPMYLLSGFGSGIISALNYSQRIAKLPTTAITNQFSPIAGIKFNELSANKEYEKLSKAFNRSTNILIFILSAIATLTLLYNTDIIRILYERGAFDKNTTTICAGFLLYFILSIPFISINTMVSRMFMANYKIKQYFWYQLCKNIVLIALSYLLINKIGVLGYPISMLIVNILNVPACKFILWTSLNFVNFNPVIKTIFKVLVINLISSLPVLLFNKFFGDTNIYIKVLLGSTIFATSLIMLNQIFVVNVDAKKSILNIFNKIINRLKSFI